MNALLERDQDLAIIGRAIAGGGAIVVVEGPGGIGKTSLLRRAADDAARAGTGVLTARGAPLETSYPFGVVRQLFSTAVVHADPSTRTALLAGPASLALPAVDPTAPAPEHASVASDVIPALYWLAATLARERPLLIVIDDLQWVDAASAQFLTHLAVRIAGTPVTILLGTRPSNANPIPATADVVRVEPRPLSAAGGQRLLEAEGVVAGDHVAQECHRVTGGNPFYLTRLARALRGRSDASPDEIAAAGADAVTRDVCALLDDLGEDAKHAALALAALGEGQPASVIGAVAGLGEAAVEEAVEALRRADLVATPPLAFAHPILRTAVEQSIPAGLHRRAATVLEASGAPAEEVAAQLAREAPSGDRELVDRLRDHARTVGRRGLTLAALSFLERALAEPPAEATRVATLIEAGEAAMWAGRLEARAYFEEAVARAANPIDRGLALGALGRFHANVMQHLDAVTALEAALAALPEEHECRATLEHLLVACGLQDVRLAERALPHIVRLAGQQESTDPELVAIARALAAGVTTGSNEAVLHWLEPVRRMPPPDATGWDVRAVSLGLLLACEQYDAVEAMASEATVIGERTGIARPSIIADGMRAISAWARGRLDDAIAHGCAAIAVCEQLDAPGGVLAVIGPVAMAKLEQGDVEGARTILDRVEPDDHGHLLTALVHSALALYHLSCGSPVDAVRAIERGDALFGGMSPSVWSWRSPAVTALRLAGDLDRARELAAEELGRARALRSRRPLGVALRDAATVATGTAAVDLATESVSVLRGSRADLELARSVQLLAQLVSEDEPSRGRALLDEALALAVRCRATRLIDSIARDPRDDPPESWPAVLTRSEAQVADLAARGLSNQEIAAHLHLSLSTVKTHLVHVYAKLHVRNRVELTNRRRSGSS